MSILNLKEIRCNFCDYYHEKGFFKQIVKMSDDCKFAVCLCCFDDMNEETRSALQIFTDALDRQLNAESHA